MSIRSIAKVLKLKQLSAKFNFNTSIKLNGKKFKVPVLKNMGLLNLKLKEDWFSELLRSLEIEKDSTFIDVGVNVGQTLLIFRSLYNSSYYGFEPNPSCVHYLNCLIEVNEMKNTNILPVGLSSENSMAKFYLKNAVDSAGTIVNDLRPDYYEEVRATYVPLFVFDKLDLEEINKISVIKIDVEGAELEVLSGMANTIQKHQPKIICEILDCHSEKSREPMQTRANKLVALMRSLNYDIYRIRHKGNSISYEKIEEVKLVVWVPESFELNDYLFVPKGKDPVA